MEYSILPKIESPEDVKVLTQPELKLLCEELRDCIMTTVSKNGGHLASNLGTVELTVALHRAFSSPKDAIIFDVGHQCYTHKLLTGRFKDFSSLRTKDGISGFMRPDESVHDPFITGHSSNSISAAYGIYKAKKIKGEDGTAVAVIGDGAMTGGMAYEALNNAGNGKGNFIIVLNDNKMSISRNVGSLSRSLTKMRNKPRYHKFKDVFSRCLLNIPFIGKRLNNLLFSLKEAFKNIVYKNNIFTSMGFNYLGPVDGHNIAAMESLFRIASTYTRPSLIHVITTKGKGYQYAERKPNNYHGVSPFDIDGGAVKSGDLNFSKVAGKTLCSLAESDNSVCAITAAMTDGTGLCEFSQKFKNRFFDVGIAEQHALTFSAGLAKEGLKPYFAVYSSFLQRAYDQIIHDAAIAKLPIKLLIDRAGIVGEDGETHQGLFDVSFLTSIPGVSIYSPSSYNELEYQIKASAKYEGITAIRYPRGCEKPSFSIDFSQEFSVLGDGKENLIITYGRLFSEACIAREQNPDITILKLNKVFPFSKELINTVLEYKNIQFFEESEKSGGIGEHLSALLIENGFKGKYRIHCVDNKFVPAASVAEAISLLGLDSDAMLSSFD